MHPPPDPPPRARAVAVLRVPPDCTPADARAAFLRRVAADGFVPPEACVAAANRLAGTAVPLSAGGAEVEVAHFRNEIEAFAAAYWSLPPADRRARWAGLSAGATDEPPAARLRGLEAGLDLAVEPHPNPLAEEVAGAVRELYVLGPRGRAVRRAGWVAARADRVGDLADGYRRLRADAPLLAALEPELPNRLTRAVPLAPVAARGLLTGEQLAAVQRDFTARLVSAVPPRPSPKAAPAGEGIGWKSWVGGLWIAFILLRLVASSSTTTTTPRSEPYYTPPPVHIAPIWNQTRTFTELDVKAFRAFEFRRDFGTIPASQNVPPAGYTDWVLLGRPAGGPFLLTVPSGRTVPTRR